MNLLIKNVQIIDGTGKQPYKADVLIKDDRISAIGNLADRQADQIINGLNGYLVPGFIDLNTDSDHYLSIFSNPSQKDFLLQGVTTIIGGQCGASLAPLLYGTLESIKWWSEPSSVNVNWHSVKELIANLEKQKLGVNFGTLVGHQTIKQAIVGDIWRDLTANEMPVFKRILLQSLEEGAFGFSSGLGYFGARQTSYYEIKELVQSIAGRAIYATHLRDEERGILTSISETMTVAKETGARTMINHLHPLIGNEEAYGHAMELLSQSDKSVDVSFNIYPFDSSTRQLTSFLPSWLKHSGNIDLIIQNFKIQTIRESIINELPNDLEQREITISFAPGNDHLVGKTLKEFSENRKISLKEGLLELAALTKLKCVVFDKNLNEELVIQALGHEKSLISSNSASLPDWDKNNILSKRYLKPERATKTFTKFLEIISEKNIMPIEVAIRKITAAPAEKLNLKERGVIKEGNIADLVILRNNQIDDVIVGGKIAVKDKEYQNILAGKILKRS